MSEWRTAQEKTEFREAGVVRGEEGAFFEEVEEASEGSSAGGEWWGGVGGEVEWVGGGGGFGEGGGGFPVWEGVAGMGCCG